ncbi:MAG: DNA polymerase III subunit alpha, partial [Bacilli bacterium]
MKAPNGQPITQYSMQDSDFQGGLKLDNLTIEGLDRIRKTVDLLIKQKKISWKGSLKETYKSVLSPNVLEYNHPQMWENLYKGEVINAFQMETDVGKNALAKVQPHSLNEIVAVNSLMRLSTEGEQPIDRFVRHKKDINIWYKEMVEYGLNNEEIELMKKHLLVSYGVATTQEDAMRLSMDVAHFSLSDANGLRKFIAKAKAKHLREEMRNKFYNMGLQGGSSKNLLDYVWEEQLEPMFGYS